jgi:hypothetical protein
MHYSKYEYIYIFIYIVQITLLHTQICMIEVAQYSVVFTNSRQILIFGIRDREIGIPENSREFPKS